MNSALILDMRRNLPKPVRGPEQYIQTGRPSSDQHFEDWVRFKLFLLWLSALPASNPRPGCAHVLFFPNVSNTNLANHELVFAEDEFGAKRAFVVNSNKGGWVRSANRA
jgi:hypothetical protein